MMTRVLCRRLANRDDSGFAMLTVLLAMVILTLLGSVLLANGLSALPLARHQQDFNAALGAAEAGVDDYIARLNQNYNYATSPDSNTAFTNFVPVAAGSPSSYTYAVDTSQLAVSGGITLSVTGRTGKVTRTVRVGLRPYGFLDALSQTDYNLVDPNLLPVLGDVQKTMDGCRWRAWEPGPGPGGLGPASGCKGLYNYWVTGNVLDGPMQSNDDYYLNGTPRFNDTVDSGDPSAARAPYWQDPANGAGDAPVFAAGPPNGQHFITLPPSGKSLQSKTTPGAAGTGCLYTGPTAITITGATMTVLSPDTKLTNVNCVGTNVPLPVNRTIYVQDIPGVGDPNYGPCMITVNWSGDACGQGDAFVRGNLTDELTVVADNNIILTGNVTYDSFTATGPRRVLGLIATNSVLVNHPVTQTGCAGGTADSAGWCNVTGTVAFGSDNYAVPLTNPTINAAMLSLQHSFSVLNFDKGLTTGLGAVRLKGSVAGKFMDTEGTFDSSTGLLIHGYDVDYGYDKRLRNGGLVPPNFLDPAATFWHRISFTDCTSGATLRSC